MGKDTIEAGLHLPFEGRPQFVFWGRDRRSIPCCRAKDALRQAAVSGTTFSLQARPHCLSTVGGVRCRSFYLTSTKPMVSVGALLTGRPWPVDL